MTAKNSTVIERSLTNSASCSSTRLLLVSLTKHPKAKDVAAYNFGRKKTRISTGLSYGGVPQHFLPNRALTNQKSWVVYKYVLYPRQIALQLTHLTLQIRAGLYLSHLISPLPLTAAKWADSTAPGCMPQAKARICTSQVCVAQPELNCPSLYWP